MSMSHHGNGISGHMKEVELQRRFLEQITGTAKREYPAGRMGAEDDGVLSYAIANDDRHRTIVIRFGKPVEWVALGLSEAEELRQQLTERIQAMRGVVESAVAGGRGEC